MVRSAVTLNYNLYLIVYSLYPYLLLLVVTRTVYNRSWCRPIRFTWCIFVL